jgi:polysaccharide deacetylase 2 family uncharacterized protein YibQ
MPINIIIFMKKPVKTGKIAKKTSKRRLSQQNSPHRKKRYSDAIRAFILVGVIVALSALISCAVIMVHTNVNKESDAALVNKEEKETIIKPAGEQQQAGDNSKPVSDIVVTVEPQPSARTLGSPPEPQPVTERVKPAPVKKPVEVKHEVEPAAPVATTIAAKIIPRQPKEIIGTLVFVIDDAGNNLRDLDAFLKVPFPLTIAVLPGLPHSAESARRIREAGKEVILHQPMEAIGAQDPGPSAIFTGMSSSEIREILARNVAEIGPVAGINNHQGSKVTMDTDAMQTILAFCRENKLFYLDSRTTADTVAPAVAKQMGIKIAERNIFIDNEQNKDSMYRYILGGLTRAKANGSAVLIGHTWSPDLAPLLAEQFPVFMEQGYAIKTASELIK